MTTRMHQFNELSHFFNIAGTFNSISSNLILFLNSLFDSSTNTSSTCSTDQPLESSYLFTSSTLFLSLSTLHYSNSFCFTVIFIAFILLLISKIGNFHLKYPLLLLSYSLSFSVAKAFLLILESSFCWFSNLPISSFASSFLIILIFFVFLFAIKRNSVQFYNKMNGELLILTILHFVVTFHTKSSLFYLKGFGLAALPLNYLTAKIIECFLCFILGKVIFTQSFK